MKRAPRVEAAARNRQPKALADQYETVQQCNEWCYARFSHPGRHAPV